MDEVLAFLRASPPGLSLLVVFAAAGAEYVLPPLPADSVVLAGALLVVAGVASFPAVYGAAVSGAALGALAHYRLGHMLADERGRLRVGRWIERLLGAEAMPRFFAAFRRHGLWVVALNRAFPGVRGVTFLAAGAARLPFWPVMAAGMVSNLAWNGLVLGLGVWIGNDWAKIRAAFDVWSGAIFAVGGSGLVLFVLAKLWQRRARGKGDGD